MSDRPSTQDFLDALRWTDAVQRGEKLAPEFTEARCRELVAVRQFAGLSGPRPSFLDAELPLPQAKEARLGWHGPGCFVPYPGEAVVGVGFEKWCLLMKETGGAYSLVSDAKAPKAASIFTAAEQGSLDALRRDVDHLSQCHAALGCTLRMVAALEAERDGLSPHPINAVLAAREDVAKALSRLRVLLNSGLTRAPWRGDSKSAVLKGLFAEMDARAKEPAFRAPSLCPPGCDGRPHKEQRSMADRARASDQMNTEKAR
jgi:hypothetical protein